MLRDLSRPTGTYFPTLDGWRAVAILMVIFHHDNLHRVGPVSTDVLYKHGSYGVHLFFAISGLLICSRLLDEERRLGSFSLRAFYIRRAFRILPAAIIFLAAVGILGLAHIIPLHFREWIAGLLFWRNYVPALNGGPNSGWYTGHFWSLAIEEHFYFLLPTILLSRRRVTILISLAGIIIGWRAYVMTHGVRDLFRTDQRLDALLIPAAFAIILSTPARDFLKPYLRPVLVAPWALLLAILSTRCLLAATVFDPIYASALVASTMLHPGTWTGKILESEALRYIGRISYGLYLWQQLFFVGHFESGSRPLGWLQAFPLNWICLAGIVITSYHFLEKPLIKLGHDLASQFEEKGRAHAYSQIQENLAV